jgi:hypothetical protein
VSTFLTALARGAVKGLANRAQDDERRRDRKRAEDLENARLIASMADNEGFVVQDEATADAPIALPKVQKSAGTIGGEGVLKDLPMPDLPDPNEKPARRPMEIARATLGGKRVVLGVNPSETKAGKKAARDVENKSAHERLEKIRPGEAGAFDPDVDYIEMERGELQNRHTIDALVKSGAATAEEADLLVHNKIDLPARAMKQASDRRAEDREDRLDKSAAAAESRDKERLGLERRRVAATEERAAASTNSGSKINVADVKGHVEQWVKEGGQMTRNGKIVPGSRREYTMDELVQGIKKFYPSIPSGQAYGIASAAAKGDKRSVDDEEASTSGRPTLEQRQEQKRAERAAHVSAAGKATPPPAPRKTVSAEDAAKAKKDPKFAAWLKQNGYL